MTDLQALIALLERFGIKEYILDANCVILAEGKDPKIKGYNAFYTVIAFDNEEHFVSIGAYE